MKIQHCPLLFDFLQSLRVSHRVLKQADIPPTMILHTSFPCELGIIVIFLKTFLLIKLSLSFAICRRGNKDANLAVALGCELMHEKKNNSILLDPQ